MIRSTKAILLKEVRENSLWARLVFIVSIGVLAVGINGGLDTGLPLIQPSFLRLCMLMYPLVGLSLGFLQIYQDSRPGRWQFVTHRPVSRTRLFSCKVVAGSALYLLATVLPLLVIFMSVSIPGYLAGPVTWDMILPAMAYVVAGLMWYAVGMLIAARPARWFGSRLMPVSVPILGMIMIHVFAITFCDAILMMLPCAVLLVTAAWGVFVAGDEPARSNAWSRMCTGIGVGLGWMMAVVALLTFIGGLLEPFMSRTTESSASRYYQLDEKGDPQAVQGTYDLRKKTLSGTTVYLTDEQAPLRVRRAQSEGFLTADSHARLFDSSPYERWYSVASHGTVDGYSSTGRFVGSFGRDGFASPGHAPKPFDRDISPGLNRMNDVFSTLVTPNAVYVLDIPKRQVREVFASQQDDPIIGEGNLPPVGKNNVVGGDDRVVVTRSQIHFLHGFNEQASIPREQVLTVNIVTVGRTEDGNYVAWYGMGNPLDVFIYDQSGKLIRQRNIPADPKAFTHDPTPWWYLAGMVIPNPPVIFVVIVALHGMEGTGHVWLPLGGMVLQIAVYVLIGFRMLRARHIGRDRMMLWLCVVGCLGLSGIFLLMSMLEKQKSIRCRSCGKRRLVTEERCPNCRTAAEGPVMLGIEIFDSACGISSGVA